MTEIGRAWSVRFVLANGSENNFHIVMSRILSSKRLILCANKPFRPGVKLSVTPEPSHSPPTYYNTSSVGLCVYSYIGKREREWDEEKRREKEKKWRLGPKQELIALNWPEKRLCRFEMRSKYPYTCHYYDY